MGLLCGLAIESGGTMGGRSMSSADVFLMGTSGNFYDPNRSMWREPIKSACAKIGVTCFDPVKEQWTEESAKQEADALEKASILVMAITANTAGIASLAESGWTVVSAMLRRQKVGIWIDPSFEGEQIKQSTQMVRLDEMRKQADAAAKIDSMAEASRRARKLVNSHAGKLAKQYPTIVYVAKDLRELAEWTVATAKSIGLPKRPSLNPFKR